MLQLKAIVQQLGEKDFEMIESNLKSSGGTKYLRLLLLLRTGKKSDRELINALEINAVALSTLKSRLYSKLQEFLHAKLEVKETDNKGAMSPGANINEILFSLPRESSIAALRKLEKHYADRNELFSQVLVLSALKKATKNTNACYLYSQQFNKAMAVAIADEKCDDLLIQFATALGSYWHSREDNELDLLLMIKKEIINYTGLYTSGHFNFINGFIELSLLTFIPWSARITDSCNDPGNAANRLRSLMSDYPEGPEKKTLGVCVDYLFMLNYAEKGDLRNSRSAFERLSYVVHVLFLMGNYSVFPGRYLEILLVLNLSGNNKLPADLAEDTLAEPFRPIVEDQANYISWMKFRAMVKYHNREYEDAIVALNRLQNDLNLKRYLHADLDVRCFQALLYILDRNHDKAMNIIFNLGRKLRDIQEGYYDNLKTALRIMTMAIKGTLKTGDEMSELLLNSFQYQNTGRFRIMDTVSLEQLVERRKEKTRYNEKA